MSTTILTPEQVGDLYNDWFCFFKDNPGSSALCIGAIEQAVLQSPEVQAWKRDAERWRFGAEHAFPFKGMVGPNEFRWMRADRLRDSGGLFGSAEDAIDAAMEKQA